MQNDFMVYTYLESTKKVGLEKEKELTLLQIKTEAWEKPKRMEGTAACWNDFNQDWVKSSIRLCG